MLEKIKRNDIKIIVLTESDFNDMQNIYFEYQALHRSERDLEENYHRVNTETLSKSLLAIKLRKRDIQNRLKDLGYNRVEIEELLIPAYQVYLRLEDKPQDIKRIMDDLKLPYITLDNQVAIPVFLYKEAHCKARSLYLRK